jgi:hypothetical protein
MRIVVRSFLLSVNSPLSLSLSLSLLFDAHTRQARVRATLPIRLVVAPLSSLVVDPTAATPLSGLAVGPTIAAPLAGLLFSFTSSARGAWDEFI